MVFTFNEWINWYNYITGILGIDKRSDVKARDILSRLLGKNYVKPEVLTRTIKDKNVFVFGAGPSLINDLVLIKQYLKIHRYNGSVVIVADDATKTLLEHGIIPDIIVTDLDGDLETICYAGVKGSILVIHGHGDNIDKLEKYVPLFIEKKIYLHGTTQVKPTWNVFNYYGFTDGDRSVFLALHYKAKRIILVGMDLGPKITSLSGKNKENPLWIKNKLVKLDIAYKLLEEASHKTNIPLYTLSSRKIGAIISIPGEQASILTRN